MDFLILLGFVALAVFVVACMILTAYWLLYTIGLPWYVVVSIFGVVSAMSATRIK